MSKYKSKANPILHLALIIYTSEQIELKFVFKIKYYTNMFEYIDKPYTTTRTYVHRWTLFWFINFDFYLA